MAFPSLVVGYSGHHRDDGPVGTAAELAARIGATVHVVHVITLDDYPVDTDCADWDAQARRTQRRLRSRLEATLAGRGIPWAFHQVRGDPAAALARTAREHDAIMIVLGSSGADHHRPRRGNGVRVARELLARQDRPVLLVPHRPGRSRHGEVGALPRAGGPPFEDGAVVVGTRDERGTAGPGTPA